MQTRLCKEKTTHTPKSWAVSFLQLSSLEWVWKMMGKNSNILPPRVRWQLDSSHTSACFQQAANGTGPGSDRRQDKGLGTTSSLRAYWVPPAQGPEAARSRGSLPWRESYRYWKALYHSLSLFPSDFYCVPWLVKQTTTKNPSCPTQKIFRKY